MSHYEISPREREDEQLRDYHEFDHVDETYDEHIRRVTEARLSERPKAGTADGCNASKSSSTPGTGRSESRDERAA